MTWKPVVLAGLVVFLVSGQTAPAAAHGNGKGRDGGKSERRDGDRDDERHSGKKQKNGDDCRTCGCGHKDNDVPRDDDDGLGKCKKRGSDGGIFTTDARGFLTPGDHFAQSTDVYLNAGALRAASKHDTSKHDCNKHGCKKSGKGKGDAEEIHGKGSDGRNGLPDGLYYFQVTDPSGKRLLSQRPLAERQVEVIDGYVQGGTTSHDQVTLAAPYPAGYSIVQLAPFSVNSPSGVHRVWLTPVSSYRPGQGSFGFFTSCSWTENFKVHKSGEASGPTTISGFVFHDRDRDRVWDMDSNPPETTVASVPLEIFEKGSSTPLAMTFTGALGGYGFEVSPKKYPATYEIRPVPQHWLAPTQRPVLTVKLTKGGTTVTHVDLGVVYIGAVPTNVGMTPYYWTTGYGQSVLQNVLWPSGAAQQLSLLNAGILKQSACPSGGPFKSTQQLTDFLSQNAFSSDAQCAIAANWLSISLAYAAEGGEVPADGVYHMQSIVVDAASMDALVFLGLEPDSEEPVFMTLGELLSLVASDFGGLDAKDKLFYLLALRNAGGNATFLLDFPSGGA